MPTNAHLSKPANKRSPLETCQQTLASRGTCRQHTLSSLRHMDLNEDARSGLETCQQTLTYMQTTQHTLSSLRHMELNEDARSGLETCQQTLTYMQTTHSNTQLSIQTTECRYTLVPQYKPRNADARSALDSCRYMQKDAKLGIPAYTLRPSICTCTCIVPIHADAYSHTFSTHVEQCM